MPNPVDGLPSLRPCPKCAGKPRVVFEIVGAQAIGSISCTVCGHSTKRRLWIDAKRQWNENGGGRSLEDTVVE